MDTRGRPGLALLLVAALFGASWLMWPAPPAPLDSTWRVSWAPAPDAVAPGAVVAAPAVAVARRARRVAPVPRAPGADAGSPRVLPASAPPREPSPVRAASHPWPQAVAPALVAAGLQPYAPVPGAPGAAAGDNADEAIGRPAVRAALKQTGSALAGAFRQVGSAFRRTF